MTTLREAAQQALEALEDHAKQYPHMQKGYTVDAITALRAALAEQEPPAEQDSSWCMKMNDCKTKCEDCPDEVPQPAEQAPPAAASVPDAMRVVLGAMRADPEYAWGWHCNVAMAFVDEGGDHATANHAAARFMRLLAGVDPAHELPAKQAPPAPSNGRTA